jgi:transposase InsO family protein
VLDSRDPCQHHPKKGKAGKPGPPVHDDLLAVGDEKGRVRHVFTATAPNQIWAPTSPEHRTRAGKLYLCAIKKRHSNKIVGYSLGSRMTSTLAASAVGNAIALRNPVGTVCHKDRGSQFRSNKVIPILENNVLRGSMGRVASADDNAAMESFFSLLQENLLDTTNPACQPNPGRPEGSESTYWRAWSTKLTF